MKKSNAKLNILFTALLIFTLVSATFAWILEVEPIVTNMIYADGDLAISPTTINVDLFAQDENGNLTPCTAETGLFTVDRVVPGRSYNFIMRMQNTGTEDTYVTVAFGDVYSPENEQGLRLADVTWLSVRASSGYTVLDVMPETIWARLDDESIITQYADSDKYDLRVYNRVKIPVTGENRYVEFAISFMVDNSAGLEFEDTYLEIGNVKVDL